MSSAFVNTLCMWHKFILSKLLESIPIYVISVICYVLRLLC